MPPALLLQGSPEFEQGGSPLSGPVPAAELELVAAVGRVLHYWASRRTLDGSGLSISSQRRWVHTPGAQGGGCSAPFYLPLGILGEVQGGKACT